MFVYLRKRHRSYTNSNLVSLLDIFLGECYDKCFIRTAASPATKKNGGLTIEQLAEMIGLSKNYVSLIERGRKLPSMATLIKIVNSLHISADVLLCDEVESVNCVVDEELDQRIRALEPHQRKAVFAILDSVIDAIPDLTASSSEDSAE